jgi:hypothetical protein
MLAYVLIITMYKILSKIKMDSNFNLNIVIITNFFVLFMLIIQILLFSKSFIKFQNQNQNFIYS